MSGQAAPHWSEACPLCGKAGGHGLFFEDKFRPYYRCPRCGLIFVPSPWQVSAEREKARYDQHNNDPADRGYREFLGRIIPFMEEFLTPRCRKGLDFGCGPGPVLAEMLEKKGYAMETYDLYYRNDPAVLKDGAYDFVTATEVIEHLADPGSMVDRLLSLVRPGGILALMTRFFEEETDFKTWFYKDDETHISFFSRESFLRMGEDRGREVSFRDKDMVIIKRGAADND